MANTIRAGRINGDPTRGLCERVCIKVERIYDGCTEAHESQAFTLELTDISAGATPPLNFISAESSGLATFDYTVTPTSGRRSIVRGTVDIPVAVAFTDAYGNPYTATSSIRLSREYLLRLPTNPLRPYRVEVAAVFAGRIGSFISDTAVSVNGCIVLTAKVVIDEDILVPSYGNCVYPECDNVGDVCAAVSALIDSFDSDD